MLYASLKALHLLAIVAWVGGMFFALACLRPAAAAVLEPQQRVALMHAALGRFFVVVIVAIGLALASGAAMIGIASSTARRAGLAFNMPLDWYTMIGVFVVMAVVFAHVRLVLFRRLEGAVAAQRWADGAGALAVIRWEVALNLVLGAFVIVFMRLGGTA
ncbi:MAG: hypothetical protein ABIO71_09270 [Caldimonas sp.]